MAISGSSFGALIGAAYAAGMSGKAIRRHVIALAHDRGGIFSRLMSSRAAPLSQWLAAPLGNPMLIDAAKFCAAFLPPDVPDDFAALALPLKIVAQRSARPRRGHLCGRPAQAGDRGLDGDPGLDPAGRSGGARADRRRRRQPAAVRLPARPRRRGGGGRLRRRSGRVGRRCAGPVERPVRCLVGDEPDHRRREAQDRAARASDQAECRDLSPVRLLPGERHPACRRARQGRGEARLPGRWVGKARGPREACRAARWPRAASVPRRHVATRLHLRWPKSSSRSRCRGSRGRCGATRCRTACRPG